jgi:hypothetical protein
MGKLHPLVVLVCLTAAAALGSTPAHAQGRPVHVVQTDCDTLSLAPPLVRVSFAVINLGQAPVCALRLTPLQSGATPADSCRILECSGPTGWQGQTEPGGAAAWRAAPAAAPGCIAYGQKHEPFSVVLDPLFCCYLAQFSDASGLALFEDVVCFECEKPGASAPPGGGEPSR